MIDAPSRRIGSAFCTVNSAPFASGEHGFFSLRNDQEGRHPRVTRLDVDTSRSQNWWGKTISVDSAQIIQN